VTGRLRRELGLLPLAAIVFFNVSGGPYGIEDTVPSFGAGLSLLLLVITPLLWSLPVALAIAELASALPDEGGYVAWTSRAFGPFWGFQVGWWSWLDSFVDVAVYPALFVEYARFWAPDMTAGERWLLAVAFIAALTVLNVLGVRPVGRAAVVLAVATLVPVVALVVAGFANARSVTWTPPLGAGHAVVTEIGVGLAVVMWNYSGWDTPATVLGETRAPEQAFRAATFLALPVVAAAYVLPLAAALASGRVDFDAWRTGGWPEIGRAVGGEGLAWALAVGAVFSTAGLFLSLTLTNSRLPYVLGQAGTLPAAFAAVHPRFGTPWISIVVSAMAYAAFAVFSFRDLIVLNVWLYSLSLLVELAAFLRLRQVEPGLRRPWRVPGGTLGALAVVVLPSCFALGAMATAGLLTAVVGVGAALTGPLVYLTARGRRVVNAGRGESGR